MPAPSGFGLLGNVLGGTSEESYQEGRAMGAKTEEALANARRRVMENDALARGRASLVAAGVPEETADAAYTALQAGGKIGDPIDLMLKNQEFNFRGTAGDPNTTPGNANAALRGVANGPVEPLYKIGGGFASKFGDTDTITPLPAGANDAGGGESAGIQALRAFGYIGADGRIIPGMEADAFDLYRDTTRNAEAAGITYQTQNNPFRRQGATPVVDLSTAATNKATLSAAGEQGSAVGRNAAGLESTNATIDKFSNDITNFLRKPGYQGLYGNVQGTDVGKATMGLLDQDVADARGALESLGGEAFLASIQKMRGFGQLSNQEGAKVQTALTRALDTRLSESDSRAAWLEVQKHMNELKRVAAIEAGQAQGIVQQPVAPRAPGAAPAAAAPSAGQVKMINGKKYVNPTGKPGDWYEDDGA